MKTLFFKSAVMALMLALYLMPQTSTAQASGISTSTFRDGYVMVDNEMLAMNDGKLTTMSKAQRLDNGTKVKKNGVVKIKGQKRIKMKNGNCVDKMGKVDNCNLASQPYTCTHHKNIRSSKMGKCPECGMELIKR